MPSVQLVPNSHRSETCHIRALQLNFSSSHFIILTARSFHIFTEYRCPELLSYDLSNEFAFFQSVSPKLVKFIFLLENNVQQKQKRLSFSFVFFFCSFALFCASFLFCYPSLSCSCILILPFCFASEFLFFLSDSQVSTPTEPVITLLLVYTTLQFFPRLWTCGVVWPEPNLFNLSGKANNTGVFFLLSIFTAQRRHKTVFSNCSWDWVDVKNYNNPPTPK